MIDLREDSAKLLRRIHGPSGLVFRELTDAWPTPLGRRAHEPEDLEQLVLVGGAREERPAGEHLGHDAAGGPDVDACVISARAEEDVRRTVPERHDLVGESVNWYAEGACETEVCEFQLAGVVNKQVLRLQIPMQHSIVVAKRYAAKKLKHEALDSNSVKSSSRTAGLVRVGIHVLLQIFIHILEHQHKFVLGMDNIVKRNYVLVLELLHKADLADGCAGRTLFAVQVDFLQCYESAGVAVTPFEDLRIY